MEENLDGRKYNNFSLLSHNTNINKNLRLVIKILKTAQSWLKNIQKPTRFLTHKYKNPKIALDCLDQNNLLIIK